MDKGLSSEIESAIDTLLVGLNYDLSLDRVIKSKEDYRGAIGCSVRIVTKTDAKLKGRLFSVGPESIILEYYTKEKNERVRKERVVLYGEIKECRAYENEDSILEADKMQAIISSKTLSFSTIKQMLFKWNNSSNPPSELKKSFYVSELITAGEKAIIFLRSALAYEIDYDSLEAHRIATATKVKPLILDGISDLTESIQEFRKQHDKQIFDFGDKEFKVGYPERFAKQEFFPESDYHKEWYNSKEDAIMICPFGTKGEIIELDGLKIQLPIPPRNKKKVLFSDLPKKEQYWRRATPPDITPDNITSFEDYILEEFRRRREGIWFMNNGKMVYLTGNAYWALQHCQMKDDGDYMKFRYAQLDMFYHLEACILDPRCLGQLFVKSRRTGFTYIVLAILLNAATSTCNGLFGMTSKTDRDAGYAFGKFSYMFLNLPFYFRPVVKNKEDSEKELVFGRPSNSSKDAKKSRDTKTSDYLNTTINFEVTKDDSYDGQKLNMYLGDEAGKWKKPHNYIKHLGQITPTMMPHGRVVGKAFIGSTVGAMNKGGAEFKELHGASKVEERDPITKQTPTGLYAYFLDSQSNVDHCTDIYGVCYKETPPKGTYNALGKLIEFGSIEFLIAKEEAARKKGDFFLNEQFRAMPRTIDHAFRDESANSVFNLAKCYEQLEYNSTLRKELLYQIGNFRWKDGIKDTEVEWCPDPRGRFKISWMPSDVDDTFGLRNNYKEVNGKFYPQNNYGVLGVDPFSIKNKSGKGSKGAISGKTRPNVVGVPIDEFFLEYCARPQSEEIFFEDVIMACVFYGIPMFVESNRIDLLRYVRNRGYRPFSMNRVDKHISKLSDNELEYGGQTMSGQDMLDSHMNGIGFWIEKKLGLSINPQYRPEGEMGTMPFDDTIKDWIAFDPDDRTPYDLTISSGLAIMGTQVEKYKGEKKPKDKINILTFVKRYNNKGAMGRAIQFKDKKI